MKPEVGKYYWAREAAAGPEATPVVAYCSDNRFAFTVGNGKAHEHAEIEFLEEIRPYTPVPLLDPVPAPPGAAPPVTAVGEGSGVGTGTPAP